MDCWDKAKDWLCFLEIVDGTLDPAGNISGAVPPTGVSELEADKNGELEDDPVEGRVA